MLGIKLGKEKEERFKFWFDSTNQPVYLYSYAKMVWQSCEESMKKTKKKPVKKPVKKSVKR